MTFLMKYSELLDVSTPVYILTSSIDPRDKLKGGQFKAVKGFFSKSLNQTHMDDILKYQR